MITRLIYPLFLREKITWVLKEKIGKKYPDQNVTLKFNSKISLDLSKEDIGHQLIILNGFYELKLTRSILKLAKRGGLLVDVGANYGYFTCHWASSNPVNTVIAFEASPDNLKPLKNNISKNNLDSRVNVESFALGQSNGKLNFKLFNESNQTGWGGLTIQGNEEEGKAEIEVEVKTLDSYFDTHPEIEIDVLKIDVEGADTWVLKGAEKLLEKKRIKHIFYEANKLRMERLNIDPSEAIEFLRSKGYRVTSFGEEDYYATIES